MRQTINRFKLKYGVLLVLLFGIFHSIDGQTYSAIKVTRYYTYVYICSDPPYSTDTRSNSYWTTGAVDNTISVNIVGYTSSFTPTFTITESSSTTKTQVTEGDVDCREKETLKATATCYSFPPLSHDMGVSECVSNATAGAYTFTTDRSSSLFTDDLVSSFRIQVSNSASFTTVTSNPFVANATTTTYSYSRLTGSYTEAWYGEDLYFRIQLILTDGTTLYGPKTSPVRFYKSIPSPSLYSVDRSVCGEDEITLNVDSDIADNISKYSFRARLSGHEEAVGNIIYLNYISNSGNYIKLEVDTSKVAIFNDNEEEYVFQIFNSDLDSEEKISSYECVTPWTSTVIAKPDRVNQSITVDIKETVGATDYHLTRHDVTDGQLSINVSNYSSTDSPLSVEYTVDGGSVQAVDFSSLTSSGTNTKLLDNLDEGDYQVRVVDVDECTSNKDWESFTFNKPDAVSIATMINSDSVTCHPNNLDVDTNGSHTNDGSISLSWEGGIPPYTLQYGTTTINGITTNSQIITGLSAGLFDIGVSDKYDVSDNEAEEVASNPLIYSSFSQEVVKCYGDNTNIGVTLNNNIENNNTYQLYDFENNLLDFSSTGISANEYTFYNLQAESYRLDVSSGSCIARDTFELIGPSEINLLAIASKIAEFGGSTGTISLDLSGGTGAYSYSVYNSMGTLADTNITNQLAIINGLTHDYYDVFVWDENKCSKEQTNLFVKQPDAPLELSYNQLNVDCFGNSTAEIYPKATGGWGLYEYGFNGLVLGTDTIITNLDATSDQDTIFVVDSAGVITKLPVVITQPEVLSATVDKEYKLLCFEDSTGAVKLNIEGGTTPYQVSTDGVNWHTGDSIGNQAANTSLGLFIRDANNCSTTEMAVITEPTPLSVLEDTIVDAFCMQANGKIHSIINGGTIADDYTYEWTYLDSSLVISNASPQLDNIYSGQYHLLIIDDNSCTIDTLFLVSDIDGPQIDSYTVDSISCFGRNDGIIEISEVSGGLPEYTYFIDGVQTLSYIENLLTGTHHVRVVDSMNCKVDAFIDVPQPDDLKIYDAVITPPVCHDSYEGSIVIVPTGGNGQYTYNWATGDTTPILEGLNSGMYNVIISDWKDCTLEQDFEVIHPQMPKPLWESKDALICTGNYVEVDGGDFVSWIWSEQNGEEFSTERSVVLTQSGEYILQIIDNNACVGLDTFQLEVSDTPLDAGIMLPDSARIDESINAIDVTWPVPDSINWLYDQAIEVISTNDWSQHFMAEEEGVVNVTLRAWYDGCYSDSSKSVVIFFEDGFIEDEFKTSEALIVGYKVYPNPNDGIFSIGVKLSREADITVSMYNANTSQLIEKQNYYGLDGYELPFNLSGLNPGMYVISVQAEKEQQIMKIVIN